MGLILSWRCEFHFFKSFFSFYKGSVFLASQIRIRNLLEVEVGVVFSRWLDLDPLDLSPDPRLWLIELESYDLQKEVLNPVLQIL